MTPLRDNPTPAPADGRMEVREVRAADPSLSAETNDRITQELREVLGVDQVRVPADRPHASRGERPRYHSVGNYLSMNWLSILFGLGIWLVIGGIVALTTGDWWFLALAAGLHALGTMAVILTSVRLTGVSEHPSPTLAAAMSEEGVRSVDERFSEMVDEFRPVEDRGGLSVLSERPNDRTVNALDDPATAGAEQSRSWTSTTGPSHTAPAWGTPDFLLWSVAISLAILSVVLPLAFGGGWMWLTAAVMLPVVAGWMVFQWFTLRRPESVQVHPMRPIVIAVIGTTIAVAVFCALVALAYHGATPPHTPGRL